MGRWHQPLVTARYLREQAALRALRAQAEERRRCRRAVALMAGRGEVE